MKEKTKIIIANWKMNPQKKVEAEAIFKNTANLIKNVKHAEVVICSPYIYLNLKEKLKNKSIKLGSQDIFFEKEGSFTGEISGGMLKDQGVEHVIIGHSERRMMGDTNEIVNKKILAALKSNLIPVFCIGESNRDSNGFYLSFIKEQLMQGLRDVTKTQIKKIVFAYEPVWAIGSSATRVATPVEFTEIRIYIKKIISDLYDIKIANEIRIIYGGSVNPLNAESFIKEGGADGLLVGRDSLNAKKFSAIINLAK